MDPATTLAFNPNRREAVAVVREWARKGGYLPTWDQFHGTHVTKRTFRRWCAMGLCWSH